MHGRHLSAVGVALLLLAGAACDSSGHGTPPYPAGDGLLDPYAQAQALGRGVNFGNLLDATPDEGAWTNGQHIQESDFDLAVAAGFDSVRLPVRFSAHAATSAPYTIDAAFLARVDQVVQWGLARGLRVVLDVHHYEELHRSPGTHRARFVALWRQLATHFASAPDGLYFELLNEPSQGLTGPVWSSIAEDALRAIREIDPHHTVVVAGTLWSNPGGLEGLQLPPEETNAIVTFHFYSPTLFCFQGKQAFMGPDWSTTGISWPGPPEVPVAPASGVSQWVKDWIQAYDTEPAASNPGGEVAVQLELEVARSWGLVYGRPLWMGEFTAQDGAPLESRARWLSYVRRTLEADGIPWSVWTLDSDAGSRLYDPGAGTWNLELTQALGLSVTND